MVNKVLIRKIVNNRLKYIIVILILFFSSCHSFQYTNGKKKLIIPNDKNGLSYSILRRSSGEELNLTKKKVLGNICYMKEYTKYCKNGKVLEIQISDKPLDTICDSKDSIREVFIIRKIEKVKYAYCKIDNILYPKNVYKIYLQCISNPSFNYVYQVLSIEDKVEGKTKIKEGEKYNLLLISYFARDKFRQGNYYDILLDDVYMVFVPMHVWGLNFYTTPNLKGLYYND